MKTAFGLHGIAIHNDSIIKAVKENSFDNFQIHF